jgi:hypothetical protein
MKEFFEDIRSAYESLRASRGEFDLFALLMRQDAENKWDLIVSAPSLENTLKDYGAISSALKKHLSADGLNAISRIVIFDHGGALVHSFLRSFSERLGDVELPWTNFAGEEIKRAYVIAANKDADLKLKRLTADPKAR